VTPLGHRAARFGLWLLPAYGVLLGLSTLTHQPPVADFAAYARYVTTTSFLLSHLFASIGGAALGVLGAVAVTGFLVRGPRAGAAVAGMILTAVANVVLASVFGSAAFVQPGIGRAYLAGVSGMPDLNADTAYGPALVATAVVAEVFFVTGAVVLGSAIAHQGPHLRWVGVAYAVLLPLFAIAGFAYGPVQPVAGFGFAAAMVLLARRLPSVAGPDGGHAVGEFGSGGDAQLGEDVAQMEVDGPAGQE
jgi:hypothetical protein